MLQQNLSKKLSLDRLSQIQLSELKILLASQILNIPPVAINQVSNKHELIVYFYKQLNNQNTENDVNSQKKRNHNLAQIVQTLLNNQFDNKYKNNAKQLTISKTQRQQCSKQNQLFVQKNKYLDIQVLKTILIIFPKAHELIKTKSNSINKFKVDHCEKLLLLLQLELQQTSIRKHKIFTQQKQFIFIVSQIILPIVYNHPEFVIKAVNLAKNIINYFQTQNQKESLVQQLCCVVSQYFIANFSSKNVIKTKQSDKQTYNNSRFQTKDKKQISPFRLQQTISILILIQSIHSSSINSHYSDILIKNSTFIKSIYDLLLCSKIDSPYANPIGINIYGSILKQLSLFSKQKQIWLNLYSTLRCYGAHLIKDVWNLFYDFVQIQEQPSNNNQQKEQSNNNQQHEQSNNNQILLFSKTQLIDIIFYKLQNHQNINVVRHCIHSILQQPRAYILFTKVPDAIYSSLMRILNSGMHYLDCLFHMDSKMFYLISNFFSKYFNHYVTDTSIFQKDLSRFLREIKDRIYFDHTIVCMINSFILIDKKSKTIKQRQLQDIVYLIQVHYKKLPIRKRHQLMKGLCYLLKNHLSCINQPLQRVNQPQLKKVNQQQKEVNQQQNEVNSLSLVNNIWGISLQHLLTKCLLKFPVAYFNQTHHDNEILKMISSIITENYSKTDISTCLISISNKIQLKNQQQNLIQCIKAIQLLIYILLADQSQIKNFVLDQAYQNLGRVYSVIYHDFIIDIGESLYKKLQERAFAINLQVQILKFYINSKLLIKSIPSNYNQTEFVQKLLFNVSLYIKDQIQLDKVNDNKDSLQLNNFTNIVQICFTIIYRANQCQSIQNSNKMSKIGSQFLEWAVDNIDSTYLLKCRIQQSRSQKIDYIEQVIYILMKVLARQQSAKQNEIFLSSRQTQITERQSQINEKLLSQNPTYKLRLYVLISSILFCDIQQIQTYIPYLYKQLQDLSDRYDFQNYSQLFDLISQLYTSPSSKRLITKYFKKDSQGFYQRISKVMVDLLQAMMVSLEYGIQANDVVSCVHAALNVLFQFANRQNQWSQILVIQMLTNIINVGKDYWMFQRVITFKTIDHLDFFFNRYKGSNHSQIDFKNLFPLLLRILCIQQYRGYDSAVALDMYLIHSVYYSQLKPLIHANSDYQGTTCRMAFLNFISKKLDQSTLSQKTNEQNIVLQQFLETLFCFIFERLKSQNKEKMFLTGEHKVRNKLWQSLLVFNVDWIVRATRRNHTKMPTIQNIIVDCIQMVSQNNLLEVKYYMEMFLMKLLINNHSQFIITPKAINMLSQKLKDSIGHINKNVTFIVISGLCFNNLYKVIVQKDHILFQCLQILFTTVLSYSCSHVAYFRGLSQYFCLSSQSTYPKSIYTTILQSSQSKDYDTVALKQNVDRIIRSYSEDINTWCVQNDLFRRIPTVNNQIVSQGNFYIEKLKALANQLVREIKEEVGFLPYKDIWVNAVKQLNLIKNITIEPVKSPQNDEQSNIQDFILNNSDQSIFQRKIDPSLDFIYLSKAKLKGFEMKILITGSKSIPVYGHLSRTGEIFGLSQLIIPYKQIIQQDSYKAVACTAQKWLNITSFTTKNQCTLPTQFNLCLERCLIKLKQQGYTFFLLGKNQQTLYDNLDQQLKHQNLTQKCLLIVDLQELLTTHIRMYVTQEVCFGQYYSPHVQASIFIWEYFRQLYHLKFNANTKS